MINLLLDPKKYREVNESFLNVQFFLCKKEKVEGEENIFSFSPAHSTILALTLLSWEQILEWILLHPFFFSNPGPATYWRNKYFVGIKLSSGFFQSYYLFYLLTWGSCDLFQRFCGWWFFWVLYSTSNSKAEKVECYLHSEVQLEWKIHMEAFQ